MWIARRPARNLARRWVNSKSWCSWLAFFSSRGRCDTGLARFSQGRMLRYWVTPLTEWLTIRWHSRRIVAIGAGAPDRRGFDLGGVRHFHRGAAPPALRRRRD